MDFGLCSSLVQAEIHSSCYEKFFSEKRILGDQRGPYHRSAIETSPLKGFVLSVKQISCCLFHALQKYL